jgi:hypothetical protein
MTDESQEQAAIDWASAQVADAVLTVPLAGETSKEWTKRLEHVLELLQEEGHDGPWESIAITGQDVQVKGVQAGTEGDVRYLLEAGVTQTNADFAARSREGDGDGDDANAADQEMAAAFRSFAEEPEEED